VDIGMKRRTAVRLYPRIVITSGDQWVDIDAKRCTAVRLYPRIVITSGDQCGGYQYGETHDRASTLRLVLNLKALFCNLRLFSGIPFSYFDIDF
jgi:hypothetical protein